MTVNAEQKLRALGAVDCDIDALLRYTANVFAPRVGAEGDGFLQKWEPILALSQKSGAADAINRYLAKEKLIFASPETLSIELFESVGGSIPVITAENVSDFECIIKNIVYKGKDVPNIEKMGASFAFGAENRFIVLSNKPYSNVAAGRMGLDLETWRSKSMTIRKYHEGAHYFTKRFYGSSRNNLHDELIADFCGIYEAFGEYRAEWFLKFLGLSEDSEEGHGRVSIYIKDLSDSAVKVIKALAAAAADGVEALSKTEEFSRTGAPQRIKALCERDLLSYV